MQDSVGRGEAVREHARMSVAMGRSARVRRGAWLVGATQLEPDSRCSADLGVGQQGGLDRVDLEEFGQSVSTTCGNGTRVYWVR